MYLGKSPALLEHVNRTEMLHSAGPKNSATVATITKKNNMASHIIILIST